LGADVATPTQDERREAARRALIAAAIEILADEGYRRLTLGRIGEIAGVSRGLVNYHFGTKIALVEGVVATIRERYYESAPVDVSENGHRALRGIVDSYLTRFRADPRPAKVMLVLGTDSISELGSVTTAVRETYQSFRDDLRVCIELGKADGSIRANVDAVGHATVIEAVIRGIVLQYLVDPPHVDLPVVTVAALETVDGLAASDDQE
jgi:AcrR family transcriptional regulator